ncbi:hypothetical protein MMC31_001333 [Peltigera leucophlebia]|nr:hypothetical protein [Peltigera leucophlebia]
MLVSEWYSPIVVMRQPGTEMDPLVYEDMTLADLRVAVDYFISYGNESVHALDIRGINLKSNVKGVRINCEGDQKLKAKKFVTVTVPRDHAVFLATSGPVEITRLIGCPLHVRKYPADLRWKSNADEYGYERYENQIVTYLHINADPRSQQWGRAPREWDSPGSVFVVRQDGKDIWPKQVEALFKFVHSRLEPLFKDSIGEGDVDRTKQEVIDYMTTKKNYETFFERYCHGSTADPSHAEIEFYMMDRFA